MSGNVLDSTMLNEAPRTSAAMEPGGAGNGRCTWPGSRCAGIAWPKGE